jgi:rhodanese-related sulfurtransferase
MKSGAIRQTFFLIMLAFLPAIGEAIYFRNQVSWQSPAPPGLTVTLEQARAWGDNTIWADARPEHDFEHNHIPGAILLNEDRWDELLPQLLGIWSPGKKVVVYCSTESCNLAIEVAQRLRNEVQLKDNGNEAVFVLEGGWEEWLKTRK